MALFPGAELRLLPVGVNHSQGGMSTIHGCVLHVIVGSLVAADSVFHNPNHKASAHFGVGVNGNIWQWVDTANKAWAQGAGNPYWISVETEGRPENPLTDAQVSAVARIVRWVRTLHTFPLQITNDPNVPGVGTHQMGGAAWGAHACPGAPRSAQRPEIVRRAGGAPAPPEEDMTPEQDKILRDVFNIVANVKVAVTDGAQPLFGNIVETTVRRVIEEIKKLPVPPGAPLDPQAVAKAVAAELAQRLNA